LIKTPRACAAFFFGGRPARFAPAKATPFAGELARVEGLTRRKRRRRFRPI